jgi:hypothetical protein
MRRARAASSNKDTLRCSRDERHSRTGLPYRRQLFLIEGNITTANWNGTGVAAKADLSSFDASQTE